LYHYRARNYGATPGRFFTRDPLLAPTGFSVYIYVDNDPILFIDPRGLAKLCFAVTPDRGHAFVVAVSDAGVESRRGWPGASSPDAERGSWSYRLCCKSRCRENKNGCWNDYDKCKKDLEDFATRYRKNHGPWDFGTNNCMDFAVNAAKHFDIELPSAKRLWFGEDAWPKLGLISDPATFENHIRYGWDDTSEKSPRKAGNADCWLEVAPGIPWPGTELSFE
jgi:hypothetical protein